MTAQAVTGLTNGVSYRFQVQGVKGTTARAVSFIEAATPQGARTVSFGLAAYTATEGGAAATVTVRLSPAATGTLSIPIRFDPSSGDYSHDLGTGKTVTFAQNGSSQTFTVTATQDADTADESVSLSFGTLPSGVRAGTPGTATVSLVDDDAPEPPVPTERTVAFKLASYSAPEGGSVRVGVEVSPAADQTLSIRLTIAAGEGTEEADYSHDLGASPALSFQIGDTTQEFEVRAARDDDEVDETVLLGFGTPLPPQVSAGTPSTATVTLVEPGTNLSPNPPDGPTAVSFAENGTDSVATYRLSDPNPGDVLTLKIGGADAGTFQAAGDTLYFVGPPDFEAPADRGGSRIGDNLYAVSLKTFDGSLSSGPLFVEVTVTDEGPPPPVVTAVRPAATDGHERLDVEWTATGAIAGFDLQYCTGHCKDGDFDRPGWTLLPIAAAAARSITLPGLISDRQYFVRVRAKDANDEPGGLSQIRSGRTAQAVNESPVISGPSDTTFAENGEGMVATYTATDPEGHGITWSLGVSADKGDFTIDPDHGHLRFGETPDYESPADADRNNVYLVTVTATDDGPGAADTTLGVTVTVTDEPVLDPPVVAVGPAASDRHERLAVTWTATGTISSFDLQYCTGHCKTFTDAGWTLREIDDGTAGSTTLTGLTPSRQYFVRVRGRNREGPGGWSVVGNGRTEAAPPPPPEVNEPPVISGPAGPSVAENSRSVGTYTASDPDNDQVSWLPLGGTHAGSFDFSDGALSFVSAPDYENDARQYGVTVRATDGTDPTDYPVTVSVTDVPEPPPPPPNVRVSAASHSSVSVTWDAPDVSGKPPLTDYDVQYQASGGWNTHPFSGTGTSTTISSLDPNTEYEVQVNATNDEGTSGWGSGRGRTGCRAPSVTGPASKSVPENTTAVAGYTLSDPDGGGGSWLPLAGADANSFNFSGGTLSFASAPDYESDPRTYRVTVRGQGGCSSSATASLAVTVSVTNVPPPPTPSVSVTVPSTDGHEELDVSWTAPGSGHTGFGLEYCTGHCKTFTSAGWTSQSFSASARSTTLTGLRSGTQYFVRVKAKSGEGDSDWSTVRSAYTRANTAPVISGPTSKSIPENTTAVASYTATDAEGHSISWSLVESNSGLSISSSGRLSFDFDNAPDYESGTTAYTVTVKATDSGNPRASSTRGVTVTVTDVEPPSRMTDVRVSVPSSGTGTLNVNWTAPASGAPITGYTMEYCYYAFRADEGEAGEPSEEDLETARQAGRCTETTLGNVTSRTLTDLHRNTLYGVRMKATSGEGTGDWSTQRTATTRSAAAKALAEQMALTGLEGLAALAAPNPFNPSTTIYFQVPESGEVSLVIYSLAGQVVKTLIRGRTLKAGIYDVYWAGRDEQGRPVAAGVYFYRLTAGDQAIVRKMTLLQ